MLRIAVRRSAGTWSRPIEPFGVTVYCETWLPTSKTLAPPSVIDIDTDELPLRELRRSAVRPPQPVRVGWSGTDVCHWTCWSLWLKSCGGSGTEAARYCERVVGTTSVPTLSR